MPINIKFDQYGGPIVSVGFGLITDNNWHKLLKYREMEIKQTKKKKYELCSEMENREKQALQVYFGEPFRDEGSPSRKKEMDASVHVCV